VSAVNEGDDERVIWADGSHHVRSFGTDALAEFERSLEAVPNRRRSLNGAAEAAEKSGNLGLAETYRQRWTNQRVTSLPPAP